MSELSCLYGLMDSIQAMPEFAGSSVVDSEWDVLDKSTDNAPYMIFAPADEFDARQDSKMPETTWLIPGTLTEPFTDWKTTLQNIRTRRQAIIDKFNTTDSDFRSPSSDSVSDVQRIRAGSVIEPYYDPWLSEEEAQEATPIYLYQTILFDIRELL